MHSYQESIEESLKETKNYLEKLYDDISKTLEKISSREKYINSQLDGPMSDLRRFQEELNSIKDTYRSRSTGLNERTQVLSQVSLKLLQYTLIIDYKHICFLDNI